MAVYDVLIIGGGPTGLSAAITTAKKDLTTLIIEEHPIIGHPLACGEGISTDKLLSLENMPKINGKFNPIISMSRKMDGYAVENIAIESFPGFYITGNLYIPIDDKKKNLEIFLNCDF